ncbi:hypothetical protein BD410DRAFT_13896 [Rickenella mellea]|uniref:Uncharacterized protein n=1 Tax=Rickenella mellea TaxID=50990 RepID=A0A4R5XFE2_9AGAM|nr:hypothetical protein BD410DRAFT_13896 [Rickenella mellea]
MANTLPSFVELMASLGLAKDSEIPGRDQRRSLSASPRLTSSPRRYNSFAEVSPSRRDEIALPSIVVSHSPPLPPVRDMEPKRRRSSGNIRRFAPYSPPARRVSLPNVSNPSAERNCVSRKDSDNVKGHRRRESCNATIHEAEMECDNTPEPVSKPVPVSITTSTSASFTPISTYIRRRSPTASPTTKSFTQLPRNSPSIAPVPVSLPTLPPLLAESFASFSFSEESSAAKSRSVTRSLGPSPRSSPRPDSPEQFKVLHSQSGIRISSTYRSCAAQQSAVEGRRVSPLA